MCIEDIYIGRLTVDRTTSVKQILTTATFPDVQSLVISPNQFRVGLRLFSQVFFLGNSPELPTNRSFGWTEVWVDDPTDANQPVTFPPNEEFIYTLLNQYNPTQLLRIETEGLIVQRKMTMRPANLDTFAPTDVIINMGYTEYVFPNLTAYLSKNADYFKAKMGV